MTNERGGAIALTLCYGAKSVLRGGVTDGILGCQCYWRNGTVGIGIRDRRR